MDGSFIIDGHIYCTLSDAIITRWLKTRINNLQLSIFLLSFYPFINGWYAGQNHVLTLLLVCGLIYFMLDDRWYLVGIFSGLTIYKPQFIVGFLIVWLVWKKYKAVLTFGLVATLWIGISIIQHGLLPYTSYLQFNDLLLSLPYINGFPGYLMITPYGLLATLLPREAHPILESLLTIWVIASTLGLTLLAYQYRRLPMSERTPVVIIALLYPFLATPYALFHDLLLLFPVFILWSRQYQSRKLLNLVVVFYLAAFIMPILGYAVKVAFLAIIPIGVLICYLRYLIIDKGLPGKLRVI